MGCIETKGITPYYIDLDKRENKDMKAKTRAYNLAYMRSKMTVHERINMKSWHPLPNLIYELHLVNDTYMTCPAILTFCGIALHDDPYGTYKKGFRLDGVTSDSIFGCGERFFIPPLTPNI